MRVLQLIDSLRPGGAEKMAVNIANALLSHVEGSFLCCTRQEGMLKTEISAEVGYLFVDKKHSFDLRAILKLRKFIREKNIKIVHAHSTSYFMAGLLKLSGSNFKLIWHDHYGESELLEKRKYKILKKFSGIFDGIISVNTLLKDWALKKLNCKNVIEIKNFIPTSVPSAVAKVRLKGNEEGFKIVCIANLRPQKDHFNLLKAFENLKSDQEVSLHLIGEDPGTPYSASFLGAIKESSVKNKIFYYGAQSDVMSILDQADLGVLSSRSEGLPLVLLEYGTAGLPVVSTNVGKCAEVLSGNAILVPASDFLALANGILNYLRSSEKRRFDSTNLHQHIIDNYSERSIISTILNFYKKLLIK